MLHSNSVLYKAPPAWVVVHEAVTTDKEFVMGAVKVEKEWLTQLAPHFFMLEARHAAPSKRGLATTFVDDVKRQRTTGEEPQPQDAPAMRAAEVEAVEPPLEDEHEAVTPPRE